MTHTHQDYGFAVDVCIHSKQQMLQDDDAPMFRSVEGGAPTRGKRLIRSIGPA